MSHNFLYISTKFYAQTNCDLRDKAKNMCFYIRNIVIRMMIPHFIAEGFIRKAKIKNV